MTFIALLENLLTIRAHPIKGAGVTLPGVLTTSRKFLWYYAATWPDGTLVASLHLGEGIVMAGDTLPWRVMRRDRTRTLLRATPSGIEAVASYYPGGSGVTGDFSRITDGASREGGFDIYGRGWRGGVIVRRDTKERSVLLRGDGDPPDIYYMEPIPKASSQPSLASALLLAYVLTEREVREGSWIKRPGGPVG